MTNILITSSDTDDSGSSGDSTSLSSSSTTNTTTSTITSSSSSTSTSYSLSTSSNLTCSTNSRSLSSSSTTAINTNTNKLSASSITALEINSNNSNNNNSSTTTTIEEDEEDDYIDFNINLTNKFKNELININHHHFDDSSSSTTTTSNECNTPKSNRSSGNTETIGISRNNSFLKSNEDSPSGNGNGNGVGNFVMLRIKFPESHQIITKILRLSLSLSIKECLYKIHQMVGLENYKQCTISYNQSTLSPNTTLSTIFSGGDDSVVPTIEIKETTGKSGSNSNKSSPRPILSHSNSVQSLLNGVQIKKKAITSGQSPKDSILFQAPHPSYTKDLEGLFWTTSPNHPGKTIPCLYHKWKSRDDKYDSVITVLYTCGNLEDIGLIRKNMKILVNILQVNIFCYDFTGFGLNAGKPSLKDCCEDLFIVFNYLTSNLKINSSNVILMSKSIGTIPQLKFAIELFPKLKKTSSSNSGIGNSNHHGTTSNGNHHGGSNVSSPIESFKQYKSVGGIILLNSFGPSGGLSDNIVNVLLSLDAFEHLKRINRITCPVLLVHSENDQVVNVKSSKKLSKLFSNLIKFTRVKDATHWNLDTHYLDDYEDDLIDFVKLVSPESFANRKEREEPVSWSMSPNKVVGGWLERLNLSQYTQNFLQFGYFDMLSISTLDDSSALEMIGITNQDHIDTFLNEISRISKSSIFGSLVSNFSTLSINGNDSIIKGSNNSGICNNNNNNNNNGNSSISNNSNSCRSSGVNSSPSSSTSNSTRNSANLDNDLNNSNKNNNNNCSNI